MPTSLCLGWIADAPDFDLDRARQLAERYRSVRHLLIGAWYPLLPYSRDPRQWMASQYHRPDLNEGLVLLFRRPESAYRTVELTLHGLDARASYELRYHVADEKLSARGADLMDRWPVTLPQKGTSELITYRRAGDTSSAE
jgi:alpha-galactosidase